MEHEHCICVMCSADEWCGDQGYDMFMLRWMEAGRGLSSSKGCQYVFQMLEVGSNIPNTRILNCWWQPGTVADISRISPHSIASAKLQQSVSFSSPFLSRLANSFCASLWVVLLLLVRRCGHKPHVPSWPRSRQLRAGPGRGWGGHPQGPGHQSQGLPLGAKL